MELFRTQHNGTDMESKQFAQKRKMVAFLNKSEDPLAIPAICRRLRLSVPTGTKLVNELIADGIVVEVGKMETDNGRRPVVYKINPEYAYTIGVEILLKRISVSVFNMEMVEVFQKKDNEFVLENTPECLSFVVDFIGQCLEELDEKKTRVLGMGLGITGRVNSKTGESYNYFNFLEETLTEHLSSKFELPIFLDNDTHVMGMAERFFGKARKEKNALIVNLSRGLGMTVISNGKVVLGNQGFAGEFGHMQFGESSKLCICGKRGCLGMEVSGYALEENFKEYVKNGEKTLLLPEGELRKVRYDNILQAARKGDALSIALLHDIGFKLGKALGNVINLLNPGSIILGGKFVVASDILADSVKSGMTHTALSQPLRTCDLLFSEAGDESGGKGAAAQVLYHYDLI
ncbi:ROK family protein [Sunxiuqinia elliptica]|uniref:Sugar kinase of the NBD/HSP70 family, may contain an N-terminal HTH domain n=1 Tax=Sunxiuqinia elliptica TaxID=655355 RepID=A0A1I2KTP4_9BACT|nr:ROK family protein [Sunxiuqinia elliptica]SFF70452.1 Sugar kinase of the NBD/HSP70 family, may contain an N-terminal HTH domain [Sunxiuqinia elliptica]